MSVRIASAVAALAIAFSPCPNVIVRRARMRATSPSRRASPSSSARPANSVSIDSAMRASAGSSPRIRNMIPSRNNSATRVEGRRSRANSRSASSPCRVAARPAAVARCCQTNMSVARRTITSSVRRGASCGHRHPAPPATRTHPSAAGEHVVVTVVPLARRSNALCRVGFRRGHARVAQGEPIRLSMVPRPDPPGHRGARCSRSPPAVKGAPTAARHMPTLARTTWSRRLRPPGVARKHDRHREASLRFRRYTGGRCGGGCCGGVRRGSRVVGGTSGTRR